jgi:hypothetical protein
MSWQGNEQNTWPIRELSANVNEIMLNVPVSYRLKDDFYCRVMHPVARTIKVVGIKPSLPTIV